nr:hypothetical protein [Candidatus Aenigmarchaeota archaeon]
MHKGFVLAKNSLLTCFLATIVFCVVLVPGVLAAHDTTVTVEPDQAKCGDLSQTYTVTVYNKDTSADSIREVRIYRDVDGDGYADPGILEFTCGNPPTGWTLDDRTTLYHYCQYETSIIGGYMIDPDETETFTFDAKLDDSSYECDVTFKVATIDDVVPIGQVVFKFPSVEVDCVDPVLVKELSGGNYYGVCPPETQDPGEECWIQQETCVYFDAHDDSDECDLGLDYCDWSYTVDGTPHDSGTVYPDEGGYINDYEICFDEDSLHELTIECYDIVGNKITDVERFRVDSWDPDTTKEISEPKKVVPIAGTPYAMEWVDTYTEITLTAVDEDHTGEGCASEVDKTWYRNYWYLDGEGTAGCYE